MGPQDYQPGGKVIGAAVMAVAASYVYFLIFAQFGFIRLLQAATGADGGLVKPILTMMGLAGITGSVVAARMFSMPRSRAVLAAGFALCGAAAGLSILAADGPGFYLAALLVGLGTGLTTVTLASMLQRAVGARRLGPIIGLGTGLAYGFCNLPGIFNAAANTQATIALVAALAGLASGFMLAIDAAPEKPGDFDYTRAGVTTWVLIFLSLVWLDSAAFYIVQHSPELKAATWTSAGQLALNAGVHLGAALLAGWALARQRLGWAVFTGAGALLVACLLFKGDSRGWAGGALLYSAGVSVYSTALVFYPTRGGRPWLAGLVYAVAGWGGSALGIGLAENRHELPGAAMVTGAAIITVGLALRHLLRRHGAPA